jgi:hypothetical protein
VSNGREGGKRARENTRRDARDDTAGPRRVRARDDESGVRDERRGCAGWSDGTVCD